MSSPAIRIFRAVCTAIAGGVGVWGILGLMDFPREGQVMLSIQLAAVIGLVFLGSSGGGGSPKPEEPEEPKPGSLSKTRWS